MLKKLITRIRQISPVWIAPVVALGVAGTLLGQNVIWRGPSVRITMANAHGITPGKTLVKFRSVTVGTVSDLTLTPDFKHVVAIIRMNPGTDSLLRKGTQFYLVNPQVSAGRITGLETMFSGAYLRLFQGEEPSALKTDYTLSDVEPLLFEQHGGRYFTVESDDPLKIDSGDEVSYQGVKIGQVMRITNDLSRRKIFHEVYIYKPYVDLVTDNAAFYAYGGVNLSLDARGFNLDVDSIGKMVRGGICLEHFDRVKGKPAEEKSVFKLYRNRKLASVGHFDKRPSYVVMLSGNIDDLAPRSKVFLRGIEIGEVIDTPWYENENGIFRAGKEIPVRLAITRGDPDFVSKLFAEQLRHGRLCASVRSSSLLATNDVIDLTPLNSATCAKPRQNTYRGLPVIPSSQTASLREAFGQTLEKFRKLDVEGLNRQISAFITSADDLMKEATNTTRSINRNQSVRRLIEAIDAFGSTVKSYGPDAGLQREINGMIEDLRNIANTLRPVMREVGQKPNSLVFPSNVADPVPRARR